MRYHVSAFIEDRLGHTDAAYDLCGENLGPKEIITALAEALQQPVKQMLMAAGEFVGYKLTIVITDVEGPHGQ